MIKSMHLETERLVIRAYEEKDFQQSFTTMQNQEVLHYLHMDVMSKDEYRQLFNWLIQSYEQRLDEPFKYSFGVFLKGTDTFVGWVGVGYLELMPNENEIYYLIGREYWGNGYATEAITRLLSYCFNDMQLKRVVAKVDPRNVASKRIIEKLGLTFEYVLDDLPEPYNDCNGELLYSISASEYQQLQRG